MTTAVFQSYRTENVPAWILRCLRSVRSWAEMRGFQYRFLGDEIFDVLPEHFKKHVNNNVVPMSDLARLMAAKKLLSQDFERVIWVDADVIVFDPTNFGPQLEESFAFCREVWTYPGLNGQLIGDMRVNNCVSQYSRNNPFLDYYIYSCSQLAANGNTRVHKTSFGTSFLTNQYALLKFPLINNVGMLSPILVSSLATQTTHRFSQFLGRYFKHRLAAANLCSSFRGTNMHGVEMSDGLYEAAIASLVRDGGQVLNQYLR